jgi:hypothetical protein
MAPPFDVVPMRNRMAGRHGIGADHGVRQRGGVSADQRIEPNRRHDGRRDQPVLEGVEGRPEGAVVGMWCHRMILQKRRR